MGVKMSVDGCLFFILLTLFTLFHVGELRMRPDRSVASNRAYFAHLTGVSHALTHKRTRTNTHAHAHTHILTHIHTRTRAHTHTHTLARA